MSDPCTGRDPSYREVIDAAGTKSPAFARQIAATAGPFLTKPMAEADILDLGCGYGHTALELARLCRTVVGIEPSATLSAAASELARESGMANVEFRRAGVDDLNDADAYDVVVLDNVFEHLPAQEDALQRIARAIRKGGALYLLTPNKLWPIEAHYRLPFLSYLPLPLANRYLRITGRGTDYADASYAPTYGRLRSMLEAAGLEVHFVVPRDLSLTVEGPALHYRIGAFVLERLPWLWRISKGFLVIAVKSRVA